MRPFLFGILIVIALEAGAYETDQHSNRLVQVEDSLGILDDKVNSALQRILRDWDESDGKHRNMRFAQAVYDELGGLHWVDKIERWVVDSPRVEKYPQSRYRSIYQGLPWWGRRVNFIFGVGATIRVDGVMLGSDKLGHFFSQGLKYYKRKERGWSTDRVLEWGTTAEQWMWGELTSGVYSNADLIANYEGMRFYESLFENDIVEGRGPIIEWHDGKPVQVRDFTWADHVNDYWDEALNPSYVVDALYEDLREHIRRRCPQYFQRPSAFIAENDEALWNHYKDIGLKDMRENKFRYICRGPKEVSTR